MSGGLAAHSCMARCAHRHGRVTGIPVAIRRWRKHLWQTLKSGEWRRFKARLGEAENALWRLLAASRKTQKRVNALKYNIIPRYQATVQHIRAALEQISARAIGQARAVSAMEYLGECRAMGRRAAA